MIRFDAVTLALALFARGGFMSSKQRADHVGETRTAYLKNARRVIMAGEVCGICGRPVDKSLKYPDPMAPSVDHIIPISRGGHPSDIDNLQLTHWCCNHAKSDRLTAAPPAPGRPVRAFLTEIFRSMSIGEITGGIAPPDPRTATSPARTVGKNTRLTEIFPGGSPQTKS